MKLFLVLAFVSLSAMPNAADEHMQFLVLDNGTDPMDLNISDIEEMQKSDNRTLRPGHHFRSEIPSQASISRLNEDMNEKVPASYNDSVDMFQTGAVNNEEINETNSNETNSNETDSGTREGRTVSTVLYHCGHRTFLLRWFPCYFGRVRHYCYVPWAYRQRITYAKCRQSECRTDFSGDYHKGRCLPSCFRRRVIVALCYSLQQPNSPNWHWRAIVRNLPQACLCSNCRCGNCAC